MNILVIGGTGFISGEVVRLSLEADHRVTLFNRGSSEAPAGTSMIRGDVSDLVAYKDQLLAAKPDVVVHAIASTEKASQDLIEAFRGHPAQLFVLGSMDCYDLFQQTVRKQEIYGFPVSEDGPVCPIPYYWRDVQWSHKAETYDKNLMMATLLDAHEQGFVRPTVFRCPMVYGPRDPQYPNRHGPFIRRIYDRQSQMVIGQLDQNRIWTFGYVTNIAAAIVHAFGRSDVVGKVYNLGETETRTKRLWATLYAQAAGVEFEFEILPDELLDNDPSQRNLPPAHLIFDCTRYLRETGFAEPMSLTQGIERTLEWALAHPEALGEKPDYDRENRLVRAYAKAIGQLLEPLKATVS